MRSGHAGALGGALWLCGLGLAQAQTLPVVVQWNRAMLDAIASTGAGPTIASRALAIAHTCMFDAWAAYDGRARGTEFAGALRRPAAERTLANKRAAISDAAYRAALDLFPTEKPRFDAVLTGLGLSPRLGDDAPSTPSGIANIACGEVLADRHGDGSNQLGDRGGAPYSDYTGYQPVNTDTTLVDPNHWQPLRVPTPDGGSIVQSFLTPQWGRVRPFALIDFHGFRLPTPPRYGSAEFARQANQILQYSAGLTDTEKAIAEFWRNGPHSETPPGQWNIFAEQIAERDRLDDDAQVKLFFALDNALMDAGIYAWWSKRTLDYVRPITAIRTLYAGKTIRAWGGYGMGTRDIPGETWSPYQEAASITPPFPECVSGHSTFSAAAAEVLKDFTGSDVFGASVVVRAGSSVIEPGLVPHADVTLSWRTFSDAADQAGLSRRYGGIHFEMGDLEGRRAGRILGASAWRKARSYFGN